MDDVEDTLNSSVGFLYKTMLERDPRKRRVKPVQPHLLQLDFAGLDNSSDDSDFKVDKESDDDDDEEDDDEDVSGKEDSEDDKDTSDKVSVSSSNGSSSTKHTSTVEQDLPVVNNVFMSLDPVAGSASIKKLKVSICCVCLGDASLQDNEIVECDSCGASVHESCYGITEVDSVGSSASSASTEPWFCDSCKAGIKPRCELCPNQGGLFKETDTGRWVHLVCALYIPGVAFGDVDKLTKVTLFEMSYTKWGSKECCLCDDERFARTGVCIGCDAGLCRSYFHVTCAQKEGMLTEAAPDEDIADPFFAYCKQHANKALVRVKRRNWLAVQSNMKNFESRLSEKEKLRVQKKLTVHQQTFVTNKEKQLADAWVPTVKMPRMLHTSSYAVLQLLKKAELLGHVHHQTELSRGDRKKSHFPPMLSSNFASYYNDRNARIGNLKQRIHELKIQREKLQIQETQLHSKYEHLVKEIAHGDSVAGKLQSDGEILLNILSVFTSKRMKWSGTAHFQRSPKTSPKKVTVTALPGLLQRCDTCKKTHDQHLLAKCDNCSMYHHLGCLDPPLTRMPKKTKQQGWQCSRCVLRDDTSKDEAPGVDTNEPRRLRDKFHDPLQYTSLFREHKWPRKPPIKRPRPRPPVQVVEELSGERCKDCRGVTDANNCVKCDKCCRSQHLGCLTPPRTRTPRVRGYVWFCDECERSVSLESPIKEKLQSPVRVQLQDNSEKLPLDCGFPEIKKHVPLRKPSKKMTKTMLSPSQVSKMETNVLKSEKATRVHRIDGAKRPKFSLPGTRKSKHQPEIGKISSRSIIRRALVSGRRLKDKKESSMNKPISSKKRAKKPVACRVKSNVEREFFYSSRNDPMRRPFSAMSASSKVGNEDSE